MRIWGFTCLLLVVCYVIDFYRVFDSVLLMDFGCCLRVFQSDFGFGILVFRCFRQLVWGLVLFGFGLKCLEVGWQCWGFSQCFCLLGGVWSELRTGFGSKSGFDGKSDVKFSSCELEDRFLIEKVDENKECVDERDDGHGCISESDVDVETNLTLSSSKCGILENRLMIEKYDEDEECVEEGDDGHECHDEDKECDVERLRMLVKIERERAKAASVELEKERMAAATAAEETMAMILRLQNEKSVIEMEAHQYRRLAEEKQLHDQEVIESLRWIALRCQSAGIQLEDQVRSLKQKLQLHLKVDEGDESEGVDESFRFHNFNFEDDALADESFSFHNFYIEDDALDDRLVSSLDLALSSCIIINESHLETPSQLRK